jgi:hypothetical protein
MIELGKVVRLIMNDVFAAIVENQCSDHYFCARLAIDTWLKAAADSDTGAAR